MRRFATALGAVMSGLMSGAAAGEIIDSAANGFSIRHDVDVAIGRQELYAVAVESVDEWWNDDHTFSGNAGNMYIEPRALGCFCEIIGEAAAVVHLTVTFVNPGRMIRLSGGLGPLGLMGVSGNMTWEFADTESGSKITLNYAVGGYLDGGVDTIAPAVDAVLVEQMQRLKALAEQRATGSAR